jgi:hypothetical protein
VNDDRFPPDWLEPDGTAFPDMASTLSNEGIEIPAVPEWAQPALRRSAEGWAWGTDESLSPWLVYSFLGEIIPGSIDALLDSTRPDFWIFGNRGHGANSMGAGLLARCGPIFIAQQVAWGGAHMDTGGSTERLNAATRIWQFAQPDLGRLAEEPLRVAVLFSDFRDIAELWVLGDSCESSSDDSLLTDDWEIWWTSDDDVDELEYLSYDTDDAIALAARYLRQLEDLVAEPDESEDDADDSPVEDVDTPQIEVLSVSFDAGRFGSDAIPDDDSVVVGLFELVEAILIPDFERRADWVYWRRFVELTCLVFGLDGRTEFLREAMNDIRRRVLPMQSAMEVPREIAAGYAAIRGGMGRVSDLEEQLRELQREFFRGLLMSLDPTIEQRRTTVGRLRQLGLPHRRFISEVDFDD